MKRTIIIAAVIVAAILAVIIAKDQIVRSALTVAATQVIGAPVHIDGVSFRVFGHSIKISGLKIYNPAGFPEGILLDLPKIKVNYDPGALLKKKLHLYSVDVELREIGLEKNKQGELNVDALKVAGQQEEKNQPSVPMPIRIGLVKLKMGSLVYKDHSVGKEPVVKVYRIGLQRSYKNITSAQQLAALVLAEPMKNAGIKGAKIYGVSLLAGVAILPVAIAVSFTAKDSVQRDFALPADRLYDLALALLKRKGRITRADKEREVIAAVVNSHSVVVKIKKKSPDSSEIVISARKYLLPKPEIAGGILYEISREVE